jgi:hypothetical protein
MNTAIQSDMIVDINTTEHGTAGLDLLAIRNQLATKGWAALPLLDAEAVTATRAAMTRIAAACDERGHHPELGPVVQFEKGFDPRGRDSAARELGVRKWMNYQADPYFHAQIRHPIIRAILDDILGPNARLLQCMGLSKPPSIGSAKHWHQDTPYFPLNRVDRCLGFWIAVDDATPANGCMQFVPGSHRRGMLPHVQGPTGWRLADDDAAQCSAQAVMVPVKAGTVIVFDANCLHFTDTNTSPHRRRSAQYHYVSADTEAKTPGACRLETL